MKTITLEYDGRLSERFAQIACHLWPLIGRARALRLALWAGYRFARWRVSGQRWHRGVDREATGCCPLRPGFAVAPAPTSSLVEAALEAYFPIRGPDIDLGAPS